MKRLSTAIAVIIPFFAGCESISEWLNTRDFDYAVNNRVGVSVFVVVDGDRDYGQIVPAQTTHMFRITKKYTDSWDDGRNGTIYTTAIGMTAESLPISSTTAKASSETRRIWLYSNRVVTVEFDRNDFKRTVRGIATFQVVVSNRTDETLTVYLNGESFEGVDKQTTLSATKNLVADFSNDVGSVKVIFTASNGAKLSKPKEMTLYTNRVANLVFTDTDW